MQGRLLLDIVVSKSPPIFKLFPSKYQPLLIRRDPFLILNLRLHIINRVRTFNLQSNRLPRQRLHKYLHTTPQPQHKMQSRFLLNIVISQRTPILELLASENQPLLVRWNPLLILNLRLHIVNRIRTLDLQSNRLPSQRLDEYLHTTS
ncbi:hypothetical protein HanIR_Chr16g0818901 [Helianthus annuus]|nr:hypothetical protein HanIR_Chr16g0818901 [Helianthus annuus]